MLNPPELHIERAVTLLTALLPLAVLPVAAVLVLLIQTRRTGSIRELVRILRTPRVTVICAWCQIPRRRGVTYRHHACPECLSKAAAPLAARGVVIEFPAPWEARPLQAGSYRDDTGKVDA